MLAIYDKGAQLRPGRAVLDTTVNLAVRGLLTPPAGFEAPAALPAHRKQPPAAGDPPVDDVVADDLEDDDPDEDPEEVHELHDRLIEIRRALDDLGAVTDGATWSGVVAVRCVWCSRRDHRAGAAALRGTDGVNRPLWANQRSLR
jgi:hypothetical protein